MAVKLHWSHNFYEWCCRDRLENKYAHNYLIGLCARSAGCLDTAYMHDTLVNSKHSVKQAVFDGKSVHCIMKIIAHESWVRPWWSFYDELRCILYIFSINTMTFMTCWKSSIELENMQTNKKCLKSPLKMGDWTSSNFSLIDVHLLMNQFNQTTSQDGSHIFSSQYIK